MRNEGTRVLLLQPARWNVFARQHVPKESSHNADRIIAYGGQQQWWISCVELYIMYDLRCVAYGGRFESVKFS